MKPLCTCSNLQSLVYKDNYFNNHEHDNSEDALQIKFTQHKHLLRLFPKLDRINLENIDGLLDQKVKVSRLNIFNK